MLVKSSVAQGAKAASSPLAFAALINANTLYPSEISSLIAYADLCVPKTSTLTVERPDSTVRGFLRARRCVHPHFPESPRSHRGWPRLRDVRGDYFSR
jgi:hypothetical protein